ncbi:MAG: glycosyltransferase family 4 protein [Chloroflexota bacterium]|nr:glycosyltransferase family 4 protein [Chloroflexota bacterium]
MNLFIASGIFYPEPGGPATYLREMLPELIARGWDVRALTFSEAQHMDTPSPGYRVTRIARTSFMRRYPAYWRASRAGLAWADVVYLHSLGLPLAANRHAPRIVKIVGDVAWERAIRKGWIAPTEDIDAFQTRRYGQALNADKARRANEARRMDGVIVPSEYLKRMVVGWGVPPERVRVIYNALPSSSSHPLTPSPLGGEGETSPLPPLHVAGGEVKDEVIILTVGRILPWKGVDHLIRALKILRERGTRAIRLIVAGDGEILDAMRALAHASGVAEQVTFLGRVPNVEVQRLMRAADYVALYSGYEGLSHTLLESLRAGTPCIASDKGGNPEVIQHGVNGLLVPYFADDGAAAAAALAAALTTAIQPGMRDRLAANAGVGMERFTFARMVAETAATLEAARK